MPPLAEVEQNLQARMIEKQRLAESDLLLSLYRVLIENPDLSLRFTCCFKSSVDLLAGSYGTAWLPGDNAEQLSFYTSWHRQYPNRSSATLASQIEFGTTEKMNGRAI